MHQTYVPCYFCFQDLPVAEFGVRREFDYRGLPDDMITIVKRNVLKHFLCCEGCAKLIRTKDRDGMEARAAFHKPLPSESRDDQILKLGRWISARLNQQVFWLGNSLNLGSTVNIYDNVDPAFRVLFDVLVLGDPGLGYARFQNGVELWTIPFRDTLIVEEIQSTSQGEGHASRVMRLVLASADVHGVDLKGIIEGRSVNGAPFLTDAELRDWFTRIGFQPDGSLPVSIGRRAQTSTPLAFRLEALREAGDALR